LIIYLPQYIFYNLLHIFSAFDVFYIFVIPIFIFSLYQNYFKIVSFLAGDEKLTIFYFLVIFSGFK
jgi:hypothetical protein